MDRRSDLFEIIYEDGALLVINKPAGLVCHPTKDGPTSSLIGRVRLYLSENSHPRLVNRLDRETSGLTLVAKTAEVAGELGKLWESRSVTKHYLAIVHGHPAADHGLIDAPLGKDDHSRVAIKDCVRSDGATAQTEYWVERRFTSEQAARSNFSLVRLQTRTGRKHQLRIHLAHAGHPIVGDKLYGGDEDLYLALVEGRLTEAQKGRLVLPYHALHAGALAFTWRGRPWSFAAPPEEWFANFSGFERGRQNHGRTES